MFFLYNVLILAGLFCYSSVCEWLLHRFVMHKPVWTPFGRFRYAFHAHAQVHHRTFGYGINYHLQNEKDKNTIPMAWWNGPVLVLIASVIPTIISISVGYWYYSVVSVGVIAIYYGLYEYLHWCMHLPKARRIEMSSVFQWLNGHHLLHHRYMGKNFNVVFPFADVIFGTFLARALTRFCQPTVAVRDVQPLGT